MGSVKQFGSIGAQLALEPDGPCGPDDPHQFPDESSVKVSPGHTPALQATKVGRPEVCPLILAVPETAVEIVYVFEVL